MNTEFYSIAIDGPASSGKSTIAKIVSNILGFEYIDTGAMYRALTWEVLNNDVDPRDQNAVINVLKNTKIDFNNENIFLDNRKVNEEIRLNNVSQNVSYIAVVPEVRHILVELQREMSNSKNIVMDGRDIGTVVLPNSKYKFFLTATIEERAIRRYKELLKDKNTKVSLEQIEEDIKKRDEIDSSRKVSPLKQAKDAILIDTTKKSIDEVVEIIISTIKGRNMIVL